MKIGTNSETINEIDFGQVRPNAQFSPVFDYVNY